MADAPTKGLHTYRELGLLAEGGMALVVRAIRDGDDHDVVIKRIRPPLCFDAGYLRLFADEGAVHRELRHDNVVQLLDVGEDEQGPYLVFEHVDGTDLGVLLEKAIADDLPLDVDLVLAVAIPLLQALCFVHEACKDGACLDVIHRDVSPGNVLLGDDGVVKLADFGVAASRLRTEATVAGELKGKFAYMAPEQTRGERVTKAADLFSAGVVLWECFANRRLFDAPTDADVVAQVRELEAPRLDVITRGRVDAAIADTIAGLLHKKPEDRPAGADVVVTQLKEAALLRGLDGGLARLVARAVKLGPTRSLTAVAPDVRRRTMRVAPTTTPTSSRTHLPKLMAAGIAITAAGALAWRLSFPVEAPAPMTVLPLNEVADVGGLKDAVADVNIGTSFDVVEGDGPAAMHRPPPEPATPAPTGAASPPKAAKSKTQPPPPVEASGGGVGGVVGVVAPAGIGRLSISSEPWARVSVDGVVVATETPLMAFPLKAGRHQVRLENPAAGLTKTVTVDIAADGHTRRFVDLAKP